MIVCENERNCVGLAVIREAITNLKDILDSFKEELKELNSENLKRHEEVRDCFYLSETTGKKLEEIIEDFSKEIDELKLRFIKKDESEYNSFITAKEEIDGLRQRVIEIESKNENKIYFLLKMSIPFVFGILSALGIYKWSF